ncbi:glycosyltransferase family 2 protein [Suttonella sp. R2A3]|nr:glycosyltransferase family 2 protein [Suttonella sp. R2A3]UJF23814.1 glycosyltransferase family 2 protein [Suttonella sp. R2A3]
MSATMCRLSVVMIVKNEADNLRLSLPSIKDLADEIIILDSGSSDDSQAVAESFGAKWYVNSDWQGFGVQRQRAQAYAKGRWILALDADEVVDKALAQVISQTINQQPAQTVYGLKRLDYIFGHRIDHPRWRVKPYWRLYPAAFQFNLDHVHESLDVGSAQTEVLEGFLEHHTAPDPEFLLRKRLAYALTWAKERHGRGKRVSGLGVLLRSLWSWLRQYVINGRFLQGRYGFIYAGIFAQYTFNKYALLYDLNHRSDSYREDYQPHAINHHKFPEPAGMNTQDRPATLSVVMIVKNEQKHLPACLYSLGDLADEIVILDSGSTDQTQKIAEHFGAKWFVNKDWQGFGRQRQIAQNHAQGDYILALDADEQLDAQLIQAIKDLLKRPVVNDAVFAVKRQNIFCGKAVHGNAWYYDRIVRLYAREQFTYHDYDVHESVGAQGVNVKVLPGALQHFTNDNLYHFLDKNIRYSTVWGKEKSSLGKKSKSSVVLALTTFHAWLREYIFRGAILGGAYGLFLSVSAAGYHFNKYIILGYKATKYDLEE